MTVKIKNTGSSAKTYVGQTINAGAYYTILPEELQSYKVSGKVFTDVASGALVVSDGVTDFADPVQGWDFLLGNLPSEVSLPIKSPISGRPEFIAIEAEGNGEAIPSHNFMDKTTWFQESIRITGENPVLETGKVYNLTKSNIIDCSHGKITFEDANNAAQLFKAFDGGTEIALDADFTVDYDLGKITLDVNYTLVGALTVDYSYENGSTFTLKPQPGKSLSIKDAEIQFSSDISMKPIIFEIWAYNPADLPNKVIAFSRKYKNIKDIINVARQGKGRIEPCDVLTLPTYVFPFSYDRKIVLEDSKGMELKVKVENNDVMGGSYGTMTFYAIEENEL